ncbi:MAG TPA: hypothetical protein VE690_10415, partial [Rhodopila sp.]|nr:hypothetical protein [Rhodopila sp.]
PGGPVLATPAAAPAAAAPVSAVGSSGHLRHASHTPEMAAPHPAVAEAPAVAPVQNLKPVQPRTPQVGSPMTAPQGGRSGLFAEPRPPSVAAQSGTQPAPDAGRQSLFGTVTGAFRRRTTTTSPAAMSTGPVRRDPVMDETPAEELRPHVRQSSAEDTTIEIPAFLRRQSS